MALFGCRSPGLAELILVTVQLVDNVRLAVVLLPARRGRDEELAHRPLVGLVGKGLRCGLDDIQARVGRLTAGRLTVDRRPAISR